MALVNAAEMLDNLAEATREGERLSVAKLGIEPQDFRNFVNLFVNSPVHGGPMLNPAKLRHVAEAEVLGRKYKLIKISPAKNHKSGHALHRRLLFEIRSTDWRFLFYSLAAAHGVGNDPGIFQKISVNLRMGGHQDVYGIVCVGNKEAMQKEAVLLRMTQ